MPDWLIITSWVLKEVIGRILRDREERAKRAREEAYRAELKRLIQRYVIVAILVVVASAITTIVVVHYAIRAARQPVTVVPPQTSVAETMPTKPTDATEYADKLNSSPQQRGSNKIAEPEAASQHGPDIIRSWYSKTELIRQWNVEHPLIRTWTNAPIRNSDAQAGMSLSNQDILHKWKEE